MPGAASMTIVRGHRTIQDQVAETQASTAAFAQEAVAAADAAEQQRRDLEVAKANVALADTFVQARAAYEAKLGILADPRAALVLGAVGGAVAGPIGAIVAIGAALAMPTSPSVRTLQGWG